MRVPRRARTIAIASRMASEARLRPLTPGFRVVSDPRCPIIISATRWASRQNCALFINLAFVSTI